MTRIFPAKLLLFGEYTVLNGSQALAVPLLKWRGEWIQQEAPSGGADAFVKAYLDWLEKNNFISTELSARILRDVHAGWRFQSSIPVGYGLGSSGAFVAALYDRYWQEQERGSSPPLQQILAGMESYFHGSSSGMDPMVSYTQQAMYKDDRGRYHSIADPGWPQGYHVYLLDSGQDRATGPLVNQYMEKWQQEEFRMSIERELIPVVDHAIHFYLTGAGAMLEECLAVISQFQREHFSFLIPDHIKAQWDEWVLKPGVYVKLCGAGGGGYFLVVDTRSRLEGDQEGWVKVNSSSSEGI